MNGVSNFNSILNRENLKEDLIYITENDLTVKEIYEFSVRKNGYKELKHTEHSNSYREYTKKIKKLRQQKLPFRAVDMARKQKARVENIPQELGNYPPEKRALYEFGLIEKSSAKILDLLSSIYYLHGTNSSVLPLLKNSRKLIPCGKLLDLGMAPMCGEISMGGMVYNGVNQQSLSVGTIGYINKCWEYATKISNSFDSKIKNNPKQLFMDCLNQLKDSNNFIIRSDPILINLYRLKQWNPQEFENLKEIFAVEIKELEEQIKTLHSYSENRVLKALDYEMPELKDSGMSEEQISKVEADFPEIKGYSPVWHEKNTGFVSFFDLLEGDDSKQLENHWLNHSSMRSQILYKIMALKLYGDNEIEELKNKIEKAKEKYSELDFFDLNEPDWLRYFEVKKKFPTNNSYRNSLYCFKRYKKFCDLAGDEDMTAQRILENRIRPTMLCRIKKNELPFARKIERFKKLFHEESPVILNDLDKKNILNPFPILFASTNSKCIGNSNGESRVSEALLGKDITKVFVPKEHKNVTKQWIADNQISGLDVHSASFLSQIKNMPLYHAEHHISLRTPYMSQAALKEMEEILIEDVIPIYKAFYTNGEPRFWHGIAHATRTLFFANTIAALYKDSQQNTSVSAVNLAIAAAMHDSARENDGVDLWDKESGDLCKKVLLKNNLSEDAEILCLAIGEKESKFPVNLEQKIIHDADCIEILRCLKEASFFNPEELWIVKDLDQENVYELIEEAKIFISLTENPTIKNFIENAPSSLKALYQILFHINQNYQRSPLLAKISDFSRQAFDNEGEYMLTAAIESKIKELLTVS